jgi:ankyrin repeat protein
MGRSSALSVVPANTTLGEAVRDLDEYKLGALLASGASADDDDQFFDPGAGWGRCAPLYLAVIWGYDRLVAELLEFDADPGWKHPEYGSTALHLAAQHGMEGILKQLLEKVANPNAMDRDGCTPLITAALYGHTGCVDLLLQGKANSRVRSPGLGTALKATGWKLVAWCLRSRKSPSCCITRSGGRRSTYRPTRAMRR